jgi:hypothetical protein
LFAHAQPWILGKECLHEIPPLPYFHSYSSLAILQYNMIIRFTYHEYWLTTISVDLTSLWKYDVRWKKKQREDDAECTTGNFHVTMRRNSGKHIQNCFFHFLQIILNSSSRASPTRELSTTLSHFR